MPIWTPVPAARLHPSEVERLAALNRLGILDTPSDERFDRITRLATTILGTPIALIGLIDRDRQWFKSKVGMGEDEVARDVSFCAHAIVDPDHLTMVVPDARLDDRFADNPWVAGEGDVRFYAGCQIRDPSGLPMGTLCVVDRLPRELTAEQEQALADLGAMVEDELAWLADGSLLRRLDESERVKSSILEVLQEGLVLQGSAGEVIEWNSAAEQVLGLSSDAFAGAASTPLVLDVRHPDGRRWPPELRPAATVLAGGDAVEGATMRLHRSDGCEVWLDVSSRPTIGPDGGRRVLTVFSDVTDKHDLQVALQASEQAARTSLDALAQGVVLAQPTGEILRLNPAAERILGYRADQLTARWQHGDFEGYSESFELLPVERWPTLRALTGEAVTDELIGWFRPDGQGIVLRLSCRPDADGEGSILLTFTDVTEERRLLRDMARLTEELAHLAGHDPLTGLANRSILEPELAQALARADRRGSHVGVCFLDLDGFKAVNDHHGHAVGDEVIVEVAQRIQSVVRTGDTAVRLGGDEFVVVLDLVNGPTDALDAAARIRGALLVPPIRRGDQEVGASMGVAVSTRGEEPALLLARADAALYRAKATRHSTIELAHATGSIGARTNP